MLEVTQQARASAFAPAPLSMRAAVADACGRIAPAWPLDRAIAVNPHWQRIAQPMLDVAAHLALLAGVQVLPTRALFAREWQSGRITRADLDSARSSDPRAPSSEECIAALDVPLPEPRLPLVCDIVDAEAAETQRMSWRDAITHQVSQCCAAYFDHDCADWQPALRSGLYAHWRESLVHDHGIGLLVGDPDVRRQAERLPQFPGDVFDAAPYQLALPREAWPDYFEALLLSINGWASWCAYLQWDAAQRGEVHAILDELLAIRLAWEMILIERTPGPRIGDAQRKLFQSWLEAPAARAAVKESLRPDAAWQRALEVGYQRTLLHALDRTTPAQSGPADGTGAHVVFCIDVRSERFRRALEIANAGMQTSGFAGFFGLPIAYRPVGTTYTRPQLPGLLAPALEASEPAPLAGRIRQARLRESQRWHAATRWPSTAFAFVEAAGAGYLGRLLRLVAPTSGARVNDDHAGVPLRLRPTLRPELPPMDVASRTELAERVLRAMGMTRDFAALVALIGHGSQSANNPGAAALDCGACCGQTGEVNARALAALLNADDVRARLAQRGIALGDGTRFVPGLHNTTTDEVELFDCEHFPDALATELAKLREALSSAGHCVRRERAVSLAIDPDLAPAALLESLRRRANDCAETRPEWGLANNAAFLIGRRERSRAVNLDGRAFLHDYTAELDADGAVLELLLTAPMLVTHWINLQYHASTVEPRLFGSGNKVLHNVVGGAIGVFEGNGGDLRIGLAQQSLGNGDRRMHEPLRLTVLVEAPRERIAAIVARHDNVRQLVDNGWLHLLHWGESGYARLERGQWVPVAGATTTA